MSNTEAQTENETLVTRWDELVEQREWDALRDLMAPNLTIHEAPSVSPNPLDGEELIEFIKPFEWRIEVKDMVSQGDKVVTREVLHFTQIEEFEGVPPSEEEKSVPSILIWRVEDGKIAEIWSSPDSHGFLQELGLTFPQILWKLPGIVVRKLLP